MNWFKRLLRRGFYKLSAERREAIKRVTDDVKPTKIAATAPRRSELPRWTEILAQDPDLWSRSLAERSGPRVLMATAVGGHPQFTVLESALNIALTLRGACVETLLCDAAMPGCLRAKITAIAPDSLARGELASVFCDSCFATGRDVFAIPGLDVLTIRDFVSPEAVKLARELSQTMPGHEISNFVYEGLPIGEHAKAGALRYYGIGDLSLEPEGEAVLRRYLEAALITAFAMRRLIAERGYDVVVTNHGIYAPHGIINATARAANVRTVTWNLAYRKQCAIFSHNDTYHHTLMSEPVSAWENIPFSFTDENNIISYLNSRRYGKRDWIWFNRDANEDMDKFARESGIDWSKPVIGMLTNVVWDAQLHYPANAFPNMLDWIVRTVGYFAERPDLQLLIRVHPGELAPPGGVTKSRQPAVEEIRKGFSELPKNVFIIPPESDVSTYAAMDRCDSVIIYGTKTGVELSSMGIPILVAGEAWIRNKGVTRDATSVDDYFTMLDGLPIGRRMDEATTRRARMYAYHFFFRRMVPLPFLEHRNEQWPPFVVDIDGPSGLMPGRLPGLDVICSGILEGTPFIYDAERLGIHDL